MQHVIRERRNQCRISPLLKHGLTLLVLTSLLLASSLFLHGVSLVKAMTISKSCLAGCATVKTATEYNERPVMRDLERVRSAEKGE